MYSKVKCTQSLFPKKSAITAFFVIISLIFFASPLFSQDEGSEEEDSGLGFDLGLGIGVNSIANPETGELETWQNLNLSPEIIVGEFGLGLDLSINFKFVDSSGNSTFLVREEDWVPDATNRSFFEIYLPKIKYIRYGHKGDPFYAKFGTIEHARLGNGFILNNYSNGLFRPDYAIAGLNLDVDGKLVDFPYMGIETFSANVAAWDVFGGRLFFRPIYWTDAPVFKELQLGITAVTDLQPFFHVEKYDQGNNAALTSYIANNQNASVLVWGLDLTLPILSEEMITLAFFTDVAWQKGNTGAMVGFGGKLVSIINYGFQVRFLGDNFIPSYFDNSYDLFRYEKYQVYNGDVSLAAYNGWLVNLGFSFLENAVYFDATLDGPFVTNAGGFQRPNLYMQAGVSNDLLGGFGFSASYEKKFIDDWADLISPEDAVIGARVTFETGGASIGLVYDLRYDPNPPDSNQPGWVITSKLETAVSFSF